MKCKPMDISVTKLKRQLLKSALKQTNGKLSPASRLIKKSLPTARKMAIEFGLWPWKGK